MDNLKQKLFNTALVERNRLLNYNLCKGVFSKQEIANQRRVYLTILSIIVECELEGEFGNYVKAYSEKGNATNANQI